VADRRSDVPGVDEGPLYDGDDDTGEHDVAGGAPHPSAERWLDRVGSVRVRITVAASVVTALAVALSGWLLVRTVENTETHRIRNSIEERVSEVAQRLEADADPPSAVEGVPLVSIYDDAGNMLISNPLAARSPDGQVRQIMLGGSGGSTQGAHVEDERVPPDAAAPGADPPPCAHDTGDATGAGGADRPDPDVGGTDSGTGDAGSTDSGTGGPEPAERISCTSVEGDPGDALDLPEDGSLITFNEHIDSSDPAGIAGAPPGYVVAGFTVLETAAVRPQMVARRVDTAHYGTVTVTAIAPGDEVAQTVDTVKRALWVMLSCLVGVVALVAWWLAGRALRPVEAIRLEAESIGGSTIHRRLPEPGSDDEIGRLARTMNAMLGRLDRSAQRQRQFVSDASHELRSPVAAIRTDLEVALHEGDRADWPTVARAVLAEEQRLERLLNDLLVLAADEETAGASVHGTPVDMARLAVEEADRPHKVPVLLGDPWPDDDTAVVIGVPARLDRALTNLVDNAARHARATVRVTVGREGEFVRTIVDDDGPGIAPADRERIFERFTRLDSSRARRQGGAGLGLAVVRSIAARHGGYVWADVSPLGGARFTLDLPAAQPGGPA
jgi:signal transduction histidine kinase